MKCPRSRFLTAGRRMTDRELSLAITPDLPGGDSSFPVLHIRLDKFSLAEARGFANRRSRFLFRPQAPFVS